MTIKLKIDRFDDREQLYAILARAGYNVHEKVVERDTVLDNKQYFVCFEYGDGKERNDRP